MAKNSGFQLAVSQAHIEKARGLLVMRLRNMILGAGTSAYAPGELAGLVSDIMALDGIDPTEGNKPLQAPPVAIEDALADQDKARRVHEADEKERKGRK